MSYESEAREFYTHHFGLVLNNSAGIDASVQDWIESNLSDQTKEEAVNMLSGWMESWIMDRVYDELDAMGNDIGAQLIREVVDFALVDWDEIAEGYLEDYEPETDEEESEEDEIENDQSENCTVFRGESVGPMRSDY